MKDRLVALLIEQFDQPGIVVWESNVSQGHVLQPSCDPYIILLDFLVRMINSGIKQSLFKRLHLHERSG